jgi:hypothetical protein
LTIISTATLLTGNPAHYTSQAAGRLARFPPEDMVTMLVTFNRTLYAQIKQQEFQVAYFHPFRC